VAEAVLDASALIAFLRGEPGADQVAAVLTRSCISAVNLAETHSKMVEHGKALAAINHRVVVKVPITRAGVAAVRRLRSLDIVTTFTALYASHQAVTAAVVGAEYAAPYLGRITDSGRDGYAEIIAMQTILNRLDSPTRLLVASIRSADDIGRLAQAGLDTYTFSAAVAAELFSDRQTLEATAVFEAAATLTS